MADDKQEGGRLIQWLTLAGACIGSLAGAFAWYIANADSVDALVKRWMEKDTPSQPIPAASTALPTPQIQPPTTITQSSIVPPPVSSNNAQTRPADTPSWPEPRRDPDWPNNLPPYDVRLPLNRQASIFVPLEKAFQIHTNGGYEEAIIEETFPSLSGGGTTIVWHISVGPVGWIVMRENKQNHFSLNVREYFLAARNILLPENHEIYRQLQTEIRINNATFCWFEGNSDPYGLRLLSKPGGCVR